MDARETAKECRNKHAAALALRAEADQVSNQLALQVVDVVKGDVEESANGELYSAMGYVRRNACKSGFNKLSSLKKAA